MSDQTVNRAKPYQLALFPLNNGATNVYFVLVLSYVLNFGSGVLGMAAVFVSVMITGMRVCDAVTDPIIGALIDKTNGRFGKFRPFMVTGNLIMAFSVFMMYVFLPMVDPSAMWLRYAGFVALYFVWVIGYTFRPDGAHQRPQPAAHVHPVQHGGLAGGHGGHAGAGSHRGQGPGRL